MGIFYQEKNMGKKKEPERKGPPAFLCSYADMITNILTFFILLYSYSDERNLGSLQQRVEAFDDSIRSFGLPGLMGSKQSITIDNNVIKVPMPKSSSKKESNIQDWKKHLEILSEIQIEKFQPENSIRVLLPIPFEKREALLSKKQKEYLKPLLSSLAIRKGIINIKGYADEEFPSQSANIKLAFSRALNTLEFLHKTGHISLSRMRPLAQIDMGKKHNRCIVFSFENF